MRLFVFFLRAGTGLRDITWAKTTEIPIWCARHKKPTIEYAYLQSIMLYCYKYSLYYRGLRYRDLKRQA